MKDTSEQRGHGVCGKCGTMVPNGEKCEECPKRRTPEQVERDEALAQSQSDRATLANFRSQVEGLKAENVELAKDKSQLGRQLASLNSEHEMLQGDFRMSEEQAAGLTAEVVELRERLSTGDETASEMQEELTMLRAVNVEQAERLALADETHPSTGR